MLCGWPTRRGARQPEGAAACHLRHHRVVGGIGPSHGMAEGHHGRRGAVDRRDHPGQQQSTVGRVEGHAGQDRHDQANRRGPHQERQGHDQEGR
eukprot:7317607-Heterocapsa_arctica.AAC.1